MCEHPALPCTTGAAATLLALSPPPPRRCAAVCRSYQSESLIGKGVDVGSRVKDSLNLVEIRSDIKDAISNKPVLTRKQELSQRWA